MFSIIIPVYNGEKTIEELYQKIKKTLTGKEDFEVIFVFDCGPDDSWEKIKELQSEDPEHIRGFLLKKNYGQHCALLFGISRSIGDFIVTMDEDLQHDPDDILKLSGMQMKGNYDVVYGNFNRRKQPLYRTFLSFFLRKLLLIAIPGLNPHYSPFRFIKKEIADKMQTSYKLYAFIDGILGRLTHNISSITVNHRKSKVGESSYKFHKLIFHTINVVIFYSALKTWIIFPGILMILPYFLFSFYHSLCHIDGTFIRAFHYIAGFGLLALFFGVSAQIIYCFHQRRIKNNWTVEFSDEC